VCVCVCACAYVVSASKLQAHKPRGFCFDASAIVLAQKCMYETLSWYRWLKARIFCFSNVCVKLQAISQW